MWGWRDNCGKTPNDSIKEGFDCSHNITLVTLRRLVVAYLLFSCTIFFIFISEYSVKSIFKPDKYHSNNNVTDDIKNGREMLIDYLFVNMAGI